MEKILVIDLCNTLYDSNTSYEFLKYNFSNNKEYIRKKKLSSKIYFKVLNKLSNYLFKYDLNKVLFSKLLEGINKKALEDMSKRFLGDYLLYRKIEASHEIIEKYRENGFKLVIVSASYEFIVQAVCDELKIKDYIATEIEIKEEVATGKVAKELLYIKFEEFSKKFKGNNEIHIITDNTTDYKFVHNCSKAYVVLNKHNKKFWSNNKLSKIEFIGGIDDL